VGAFVGSDIFTMTQDADSDILVVPDVDEEREARRQGARDDLVPRLR